MFSPFSSIFDFKRNSWKIVMMDDPKIEGAFKTMTSCINHTDNLMFIYSVLSIIVFLLRFLLVFLDMRMPIIHSIKHVERQKQRFRFEYRIRLACRESYCTIILLLAFNYPASFIGIFYPGTLMNFASQQSPCVIRASAIRRRISRVSSIASNPPASAISIAGNALDQARVPKNFLLPHNTSIILEFYYNHDYIYTRTFAIIPVDLTQMVIQITKQFHARYVNNYHTYRAVNQSPISFIAF